MHAHGLTDVCFVVVVVVGCCQYEKPRAFDESSSESEDECDNCHGHVEKKNLDKDVAECSGEHPQPIETGGELNLS